MSKATRKKLEAWGQPGGALGVQLVKATLKPWYKACNRQVGAGTTCPDPLAPPSDSQLLRAQQRDPGRRSRPRCAPPRPGHALGRRPYRGAQLPIPTGSDQGRVPSGRPRRRPRFSDLPATLLAPRRVSIFPLDSLARTAPLPSRPGLTGRRGTISTEQQWQKYRPGCGDASAMATAASAPPAPRAAPAAGRLLLPRRPTRPRTLTHGTHGTHGRRGARGGTRATRCRGPSRGERWPH